MKLFSKQLLVIVYTRKFTFKKLITVSIKHRILWFYLSVIKPKAKDRSLHCVKKAHIWNFSGSYLAAYGLNTDQKNYEQGHFLRSVVFVNLPKSYLKNVLQIENITLKRNFSVHKIRYCILKTEFFVHYQHYGRLILLNF